MVAWITVPRAAFEFVQGQPVLYASSPPVLRSFCGACGTALTYANSQDLDFLDVTSCSLDDPQAFPPTHHSWIRDGMAWAAGADGLPKHQESRPA
jgi:hypothetical protein